jgi:AMP-activated protein kinase-like protein
MMIDETDELIQRASRVLGAMPAANPAATARIVAAVRARRLHAPSRIERAMEWMRAPSLSVASAGLLAAAALVIGFVTRGALKALDSAAPEMTTTAEMPQPGGATAVQPAANVSSDVREVIVPLVFEARGAKSVAVVGDFNKWDETASPMKRFGADGPWTVAVRAKPGRHVYAFLVDGSTLVADPRAPHARDLDYGREASVLMVTAP